MKLFNKFYFSSGLIFFGSNIISSSIKNQPSSLQSIHSEAISQQMLRPIECTSRGLQLFITTIYNDSYYKDFLGSCLIHVLDLIEFAQKSQHGIFFIKQSLNLFMQKFSQGSMINPFALLYFMQQSNQYLVVSLTNEKLMLEKSIAEYLKKMLTDDFQLLQDNGVLFIEKHSKELAKISENKVLDFLDLQFTYNAFLERACHMILFDFYDYSESCDCFKKIISDIVYKFEIGIINNEQVYHRILWGITSRFVHSLQLQKKIISPNGISYIKQFIATSLPKIMYEQELEQGITTKIDYIQTAVQENRI
jgi:hypothetical protein